MLSRSNEQDLMTIAKWARNDGTLLSLIDHPEYSSEVKVMAVRNKKLSGSTLGYIVAVSYTHLTLPTILRSCRSRWSPYH